MDQGDRSRVARDPTELDRVLTRKDDLPGFHELSADVATISQDRGWKTFVLCGYGFRSQANINQCPETWRICQEHPRPHPQRCSRSLSPASICRRIAGPITASCAFISA